MVTRILSRYTLGGVLAGADLIGAAMLALALYVRILGGVGGGWVKMALMIVSFPTWLAVDIARLEPSTGLIPGMTVYALFLGYGSVWAYCGGRDWWRMRREHLRTMGCLCPTCGYDLQGSVNSVRCSECGTVIPDEVREHFGPGRGAWMKRFIGGLNRSTRAGRAGAQDEKEA